MTTTKQHKATLRERMQGMLLLLLLLMMAGAQGAWAVDDTFTVPKNATGEDIVLATGGTPYYKGQYSSLTLGFTGDANVFKIENDKERISGDKNPTLDGSYIPNGGHVFVFRAEKAGEFIFTFDLNESLTVYVRDGSGNIISQRTNTSGKKENKYQWVIKVDNPGTYYLYGESTKIYFYGYTFTRKVPAGITSLPYHADFSSDIEPFDDGNVTSGTNVSNVYTLNSVAPNSGTAIARFNGIHTLKSTEQVTLSFTAYHGYLNKDRFSRVTLYNSDDCPLISYTYSKSSKEITDISFNEVVADGFLAFNAQSHWSGESGANGFAGNGRPFTNTAGDNPVITMTVSGNGTVGFNLTRGWGSVNKTFSDQLAGVKMDLAYIKVEDTSDNADRGIGIDNLKITSQLASLDYETGVVDWKTNVSGRYTPVIATDGSNHYLSVNQAQRADGEGGATLTSTTLNGRVDAGQDFTLSFDMKIGNNDRSGSSGPPTLTVFAANNSDYIFKMYSTAKDNTEWKLNDLDNVNLSGTGTFSGENGLVSLKWYHYIISKTGDKVYVTIDSDNGTKHYYRKGIANSSVGGLGNFQFVTGKNHANFAIDNIQVVPYASTSFTQNGKVETYTIMGEGALPQVDEGKTIKIEYGAANEVQMTAQNGTYFGAYCVDHNTSGVYSRAWGTVPSTIFGTYYKLTPVYDGTLSVTGWVSGKNNLVLVDNSNNLIASKPAADLTANTLFTYDFTPTLTGGSTYYLFVADSGTGHNTTGEGIADDGVFYLSNLTFTQTHMNRDVAVKDLLYAGNKSGDNLGRTIPGMTLAFNDKVTSGVGRDYLNFETDGTMTITLRQNGYNATVSGVTLVNNGTKLNTGYTVNTSVSGVATITASESLSVSGFIVSYNGNGGESNYKLWLNEDKTDIGTLAVANSHIMRVPGDGRAFTNAITFSGDDANKWWVENTDYLHTSSNTSIATINTDGTNGQLLKSGAATITTTFQETDYFNEKSISYTVDNVLRNDDVTYNVDVTTGKILRVGAYADAASTALLFNGSHTSETSFTYGTTLEKQYTRATSDGTVILKNETANNITINTLQTFSSNVVAWLYYEGQEENYSEQLVFQSFPSGPVKGFRVLDIGDPTDPIDLTSAYSLKLGVDDKLHYEWTDGTLVTKTGNLSGSFSTDNGGFTVSGKDSGDETTLPKVSHVLTKTGTADGYADEITAKSYIYVATPTIDGDDTYYYTWDMTASVSSPGQLDSRWTWNSHGFYQAYMPEYLPILSNNGKTLAGNEGLLVKGDLRYHTGSTGLRMNLTRVNAHLKFPVKAGMEVKIVMASAAADIEHIISNVTTVKGDATNSLYIEQAGVNTPITAYYLAKADGAVEIHSMDKMGGYIKSITLQVPRIHFNEEIITVKNQVASLSNPTINTGDATITYSILGSYDLDGTTAGSTLAGITDANKNNVDITTTNEGYVIVKAVNSSATGVQPKQGTYRIYMIDFGYKTPYYYDKTTDEDANGVVDFPSLDLTSEAAKNNGGEAWFDKRPDGYDKVVQPITYTMSVVDDSPRGRLIQTTDSDPTKTTYKLSAYSAGTIRVTATTGRISTYTDVKIDGDDQFAETTPARRLTDLEKEGNPAAYYFLNELPAGFEPGTTIYTVDKSGSVDCKAVTTINDGTHYYAKIANITGYGAIRVTATNTGNGKTASFILTIAYPARDGKMWDFYRMKHCESSSKYGLYIGNIDEYNGDESQTVDRNVTSSSLTQHWATGDDEDEWNSGWTTSTKWEKVYRKGDEQPRWAYAYSMRGDNAFIIEETAGLIIETGPRGFYTDNPVQPDEFAFNHIGLHNNASVTIPQLKKGDYIALNLDRVLPNNGAILSATNAVDLAGNTVDHTFTISRSQTDYQNAGETVKDASGARVIPGYYTFRAAADGDVTFTLEDEGYLNILSIEIYDGSTPVANVTNTGNGKDANGYYYTMTAIKVDDYPAYSTPVPTMLKEDDDTQVIDLAICNVLWSTSVGPADYVVMDEVGNLNATLENVEWFSDGGALYNKGKITVRDGYGKILVRMNNYTAEGRYLIGYTPTYSLTVGHPPHQTYPYTWNFENISGGAVKDNSNNAYNSVSTDYYTWDNYGNYRFGLNTDTDGGSLYVPGATLVSEDRELNNDEFAGLGFTGGLYIQTADGTDAQDEAIASTEEGNLLSFQMSSFSDATDYDNRYNTNIEAGAGHITFGGSKKYDNVYKPSYKMDGDISATGTKYFILRPKRPFRNGDVVKFRVFSKSASSGSDFGLTLYTSRAASTASATLYIPAGTVENTEVDLTYTITRGDGLAGLSEFYVFRAYKKTTYLTEVYVTAPEGNLSAGVGYGKNITVPSEATLTITVPDLNANSKQDWIYIKSSVAPLSITNATAAVAEDGLDAASGVYKYKVTDAGNSDITFPANATISSIGVTHILKPLTTVGTGESAKGWATESRDCAIDHTRTGFFTVNNIDAKYVKLAKYDIKYANVTLNDVGNYGVPENIGLVLKMEDMGNYSKANTGGVPLFAPAISTYRLTTLGFNGTLGNMMRPNVAVRTFTTECENVEAEDAANGAYTRFILAARYMKWKKVGTEAVTHDAIFNEGDVPVFYRMHLYTTTQEGKTATELNTLGANKAYLSLRTANLPEALWKSSGGGAKGYIGISGISDFTDYSEYSDYSMKPAKSGTYNMSGQKMSDEAPLPAGIYIKDGRKIVVH